MKYINSFYAMKFPKRLTIICNICQFSKEWEPWNLNRTLSRGRDERKSRRCPVSHERDSSVHEAWTTLLQMAHLAIRSVGRISRMQTVHSSLGGPPPPEAARGSGRGIKRREGRVRGAVWDVDQIYTAGISFISNGYNYTRDGAPTHLPLRGGLDGTDRFGEDRCFWFFTICHRTNHANGIIFFCNIDFFLKTLFD